MNAPRVCVYRLEAPVDCSVRQSGRSLILPPLPIGSYGVAVEAGSAQWEGAFDVVEDSRQVTRYAFYRILPLRTLKRRMWTGSGGCI